MKKLIKWVLLLAVLTVAGWYAYGYVRKMPEKQQQAIPVATVRQGDVVIRAFSRGELRALRSEALVAPNLIGTVQVTRLAPLGAFAQEKDLIVEFDDSEVLSRLEETELELESIDERSRRREAELAIRNNQDQVDLLSKQYAVRRAELQVKRNALLAAIDAEEEHSESGGGQAAPDAVESDIKARQEQADASLALFRQQRQRSAIELSREQQRLRQTKLLSTMSGLVSIRQNSFGGSRQMGAQVPDIREGDQVQPGMPVADVLDLSELEVVAKVGELDRANLVEGQEALIQLDALAGKNVHGKIKSMSGTASANVHVRRPVQEVRRALLDRHEGAADGGGRHARADPRGDGDGGEEPQPSGDAFRVRVRHDGRRSGRRHGRQWRRPMFGMQQPGAPGSGRVARGGAGGADARGQARRAGGGQSRRSRWCRRRAGRRRPHQAFPRPGRRCRAGRRRPRRDGERPSSAAAAEAAYAAKAAQASAGVAVAAAGPPTRSWRTPSCLLLPRKTAGFRFCCVRVCWRTSRSSSRRSRTRSTFRRRRCLRRTASPWSTFRLGKRFEERPVKLLQRSESTMVISEGLKPGEVIALSDPTAGTGSKKQGEQVGRRSRPDGRRGDRSKVLEDDGHSGREQREVMIDVKSFLPELYMGLSSLLVHKLRSLLTMLGMIFGVGAVVAMLSITAGAQKEMMSFIDLLGREQHHHRGEGSGGPQRTADAARHLAGPDVPRLPRHRGERAGDRGAHAAQALQAHEGAAEDHPGTAAC